MHASNRDDSKYSPLDRKLSTLCMAIICLPTYLQNNISYTRVLTLNIMMLFWDGDGQTLQSESRGLVTRRLFSKDFLPAMTSDHSFMTYKLEFLKNRRVHNLLAMCSIDRALEHTSWLWAGPKFHSLLSAHHLIGPYFLTTESDKRICLFINQTLRYFHLTGWMAHHCTIVLEIIARYKQMRKMRVAEWSHC